MGRAMDGKHYRTLSSWRSTGRSGVWLAGRPYRSGQSDDIEYSYLLPFTGLGYFAQTPYHLGVFRFTAALGMGGEWSLGVALVMECWPERLRPLLAGAIGAAANVGFLLVGWVGKVFPVTPSSWRWMFLVGGLPALLVVFIRLFVPESERWKIFGLPGSLTTFP